MEKKMKVVRFIPAIVVEFVSTGNQYLETSVVLYEDLASAKKALERLIKLYSRDSCYKVVRSSVKRIFIEL